MNLLEGVRIALQSLRSHKLRTFLTLLGNIVGTMSVIAVVSLINGVDIYARQEVLDEGSNVFTISRVNFFEILTDMDAFLESLNNPDLQLSDREYLRERMTTAKYVGAAIDSRGTVRAGQRKYQSVSIRGRTEDYSAMEELPIYVGRHLTRHDELTSAQVAVIGWDVAKDLFPAASDPTGRTIKIRGRHFKVVGVVEDKGTMMGNNRNEFAVVPITTWLKMYGSHKSIEIKVAAEDVTLVQECRDEATFMMRLRHRLRPKEDNDFGVVTRDELLSIWGGVSKAIYAALVPLVGISLVVGGIVLMNIMLVSVTERTREIGIRKAVGARRMAIMWQFLVESITLSIVGGILGVTIGIGLAGLIAALSPLPFAFAWWAPVVGLIVTFFIGMVFGTYPAWKAAGLDPVEALRFE
jgi:putative ABC transport system permease protein